MSAAPKYIDEIIGDFGRGAGIQGLTLGERGVVSLLGDRGIKVTFEYVEPEVVLCMTVEIEKTPETAKKVLSLADPLRRGKHEIRTGFMLHEQRAFFAVRLHQQSLTQPVLNEAFYELRRLADRFTGGVA